MGEPVPVPHGARSGGRRGPRSPTRSGSTGWALVVGGSMGGMRALEWAVTHPDRVRATARSRLDAVRHRRPDRLVRRAGRGDPGRRRLQRAATTTRRPRRPGPHLGLGVARRIAHATYRSQTELNLRFGRKAQPGEQPLAGRGRYAVESYLDHQADKLVRRFDANSYVVLTEAMNATTSVVAGAARPRPCGGSRRAPRWRHRLRPALPGPAGSRDRGGHPCGTAVAGADVAVRARRVPHRDGRRRRPPVRPAGCLTGSGRRSVHAALTCPTCARSVLQVAASAGCSGNAGTSPSATQRTSSDSSLTARAGNSRSVHAIT